MILGFLSHFLGGGDWNLDTLEPPGGSRPSIYEHIKNHIVAGKNDTLEA